MKEFGESFTTRRRNDLTHISTHDIPGDTEEEQLQWKIKQKKEYSRPRTKWSKENLATRFPNGNWHPKGFSTDDGEMVREFNNKGYEVSRRHYRREQGAKPSAFDVYSVDFSTYDAEGYLTSYTYLEEHKIGFVATFTYETLKDGTKVLESTVEQDILRSHYMEPGPLTGSTFTIDFTDIPLIR